MSSSMSVPMFVSQGTIIRSRFVIAYASENHTVEEADANERTIGVATDSGRRAAIPSVTADPPEAAQEGEQLEVRFPGEIALLQIGSGGCSPGDRLKSDADGKGVLIATTGTTIQQIGAVALTAALEDELAEVLVVYASERPALS